MKFEIECNPHLTSKDEVFVHGRDRPDWTGKAHLVPTELLATAAKKLSLRLFLRRASLEKELLRKTYLLSINTVS
jgi:hypothetical protein